MRIGVALAPEMDKPMMARPESLVDLARDIRSVARGNLEQALNVKGSLIGADISQGESNPKSSHETVEDILGDTLYLLRETNDLLAHTYGRIAE